MPKISDSVSHKNPVCPFCSLHCDDIELDVKDNKLLLKSDIPQSCKEKYEIFNC